jgi:Protein of unknown function with PCYCGC motif
MSLRRATGDALAAGAGLSRRFGVLSLILALGSACAAGDPVTTDAIGDQVQTRGGGALPAFAATGHGAELYRFARERGDVLQWMPCTCGCGQLGHASNRACYIKSEAGERTTWTSHAAT